MNNMIRSCGLIIIVGLLLLLSAAALQIAIPYLISAAIKEMTAPKPDLSIIFLLVVTFIGENMLQCFSDTLNRFIEGRVRLSIIEHIYIRPPSNDKGEIITLMKEDSERVASSVVQTLELVASGGLTLATFILLTIDNYFMAAPLLALFVLSYLHVVRSAKGVSRAYKLEIEQEQRYKASIVHLKQASSATLRHFKLKAKINDYHLKKSISTRYRYERLSIFLSGGPEIFISFIISVSLLLIAFLSPATLGADLVYYLGFIGMFALAANSSIQTALSLIGTKNSVTRIFGS